MTDEEIIEMVVGGKSDEYGEIVRRYSEKLKRYVRRLINQNELEVEDLVQESFIKAYENIRGFDGSKKFGSWIYRIAHNLAIDYFRNKKIKTSFIEDAEELIGTSEKLIEDIAIESEQNEILDKAIWQLNRDLKDVILLYYFEDKSYDEIADILRMPTANVGVKLFRAKNQLKKILGK